MLVQQLIYLQLRFIQIEQIINEFCHQGKFNTPNSAYLTVLRELDSIPKSIKTLRQLIAERGTTPEIEPIEDPPPVEPPQKCAERINKPTAPSMEPAS